jgi:anti-anti-sigma factor
LAPRIVHAHATRGIDDGSCSVRPPSESEETRARWDIVPHRVHGAAARRFSATALREQFVLQGEIDAANAPDIGRDLLAFVEEMGEPPIELDCRGLQFIDSSGLRMLIGVQETCGRRLTLVGLPRASRRIFTLTALDLVFELR